MSEPRTAAATARRRVDSDHKRQRVLTVAGAFIDRGQDFSLEQLARASQVNAGFVHRAPGLKAEIEALRHNANLELEAGLRAGTAVTTASLKAENAFLKRRLHEREQDIAALKRRLGEALGQTTPNTAAAASDPDLGERIAELEQQLFEAREALRDRDEELQAVRALNQRLLKEHNVRGDG
jgi:chromosome segregation ATPase